MDAATHGTSTARVINAKEGETSPLGEHASNRYLVDGKDTGGRFSVVEHTIAPHGLAGPLHFHNDEDEYSLVLEGTFAAVLDGKELVAEAGDLVFKPRGQWHTFWNPGDAPTRVFEIISPAGLEDLFRELAALGAFNPESLPALAGRYGCQLDFPGTLAIVERHGLKF
jgi:mannose-6-phosphate isomerase-like protein (cupin superfamily)